MLLLNYTSQFKKDYKKAVKQKKDIEHLKEIITKLAKKEKLEKEYSDHKLKGKLQGYRDCHIESDWVLIYEATEKEFNLIRIGTHSELFKA